MLGWRGKGDGGSAGGILSVDWQAGILEKLRQVVGSAAQASSSSGGSGPAKSKGEEREALPPVHCGKSGSPRSSECAFSKALGPGVQTIIRDLEVEEPPAKCGKHSSLALRSALHDCQNTVP